MIAVLIADDHSVVREGMRHLIEAAGDIRVCGEATDGPEILEQVEKHHPDVVILDIGMPGVGGLATLELLGADPTLTHTVVLSTRSDAHLIQSAIAVGADAYLDKGARPEEIIAAIRAVADGKCYFSPDIAREIVASIRETRRPGGPNVAKLSAREQQVLQRIAEGLSAKEVAAELRISTKTVEAHRTSLMRKLGVRKATELVRYALRHGLIEP